MLFFGRGVEPVGDVAFGDEQGVAGADRVAVPQAQDQVGFEEGLVGVGMAEGAGHGKYGLRLTVSGFRVSGFGFRVSGFGD